MGAQQGVRSARQWLWAMGRCSSWATQRFYLCWKQLLYSPSSPPISWLRGLCLELIIWNCGDLIHIIVLADNYSLYFYGLIPDSLLSWINPLRDQRSSTCRGREDVQILAWMGTALLRATAMPPDKTAKDKSKGEVFKVMKEANDKRLKFGLVKGTLGHIVLQAFT